MIWNRNVWSGIKIKRWICIGILGLFFIIFGSADIIHNNDSYIHNVAISILFILLGSVIVYYAIKQIINSYINFISGETCNFSTNSKKINSYTQEKRILLKGPKIVVIGGGTGLSTMLRGLKKHTANLTAIVTVGDDGGGSGDLREDLGILPPGDIRNCILALAETEPLMKELLQYRFKEGRLENQSFGNLFLAAMDGISGSFEEAVRKMGDVLAVTGKVLPVTLEDMVLKATLKNGNIITGESIIPKQVIQQKSPIHELKIIPENAKALNEALLAIGEADAVIIGPGSLYTSIIPNLLVKEITEKLISSKAMKIYVSNVMTQPGETDEYLLEDHLEAIYKHSSKKIIDYVIVNNSTISKGIKEKYLQKQSIPVYYRENIEQSYNLKLVYGDIISISPDYVRHEPIKLANIIMNLIKKENCICKRLYRK
ncbi:YvcK family protein [Clostridium sediminicola]|uniref:gluconeogenesis factor YvcK family protein n=1 Tax=Clostridium sediminicola TaxID=3114879 RepID=UPI0031F2060B